MLTLGPAPRAAHRRHSGLARAGPVLDHARRARDRTRAALVCRAGLRGLVLAVAVPGHDFVRLWRRFHLVSPRRLVRVLLVREEKAPHHSRVVRRLLVRSHSACGILYVSMVAGPGHQALAGSIFNMSTRESDVPQSPLCLQCILTY